MAPLSLITPFIYKLMYKTINQPIHVFPKPLRFMLVAATLLTIVSACSTPPAPKPAEAAAPIEITQIPEEAVEVATRPFPNDSFHDLLVAEFAVRRNRYDLALGNYMQQAHQTRDAGVTARATRLAQFLSADKATLDAAQLWVELEPTNIEAQYTLSTILAKNQRPIAALKHMNIVLEQSGTTNFAAIAASSLTLPQATRDALEQSIQQLLEQHPNHTQLLTAKTLLMQQRGEPKAALALIQQVLTIDPDDLHATVVEARLLQQLDRNDEAFARLEQVLKRHPSNRRLRLQYARVLMANDISLAKEQFEILLSTTPQDPDLLLSLALINKETGNLVDANIYLKRLLATGLRNTESHYYLGQLAELEQDWPTAIAHYQQIPPSTDFIAATNRIAYLYLKQGQSDTARQYLQKLRLQYPEHNVRLYLVESELLLGQNQLKQSFDLLSEALLTNPRQPNLLYARSVTSEKMGNIEQLEIDLRDIIAIDSNNAIALNTLGYVLANRTDRYEEAYQLITRALALRPDDPAILDSLGWVQFQRGHLDESLQLLTQAYQAFPDHEVAAHLGEVLWATGKTQQALDIWQQSLQRHPDSTILINTMERLSPGSSKTQNAPQQ
ncbi:MAG: tetratricopeptide repeat protein [Spongiibacteraceae bacterium]